MKWESIDIFSNITLDHLSTKEILKGDIEAILDRAYILCQFSEHENDFFQICSQLPSSLDCTSPFFEKWSYIRGIQSRMQGEISPALNHFDKAITFSKTKFIKHLSKEALGATFFLKGKIYSSFEQLRELKNTESLSPIIQKILNSSICTLYFELGQYQMIRDLYSQIPSNVQIRYKIHEAILNKDLSYLIAQFDNNSELAESYKLKQATFLTIYDLAVGLLALTYPHPPPCPSDSSWLTQYLNDNNQALPFKRIQMILGQIPYTPLSTYMSDVWMIHIREVFLDILLAIKNGNQASLHSLLNSHYIPLCETYKLHNPLIPTFIYGHWIPIAPLGSILSKEMNLESIKLKEEYLYLSNGVLKLKASGKEIATFDFSKFPKSLAIILLLIGPEGKLVSNQDVHEALYASDYEPYEHGKRIYKLFERLEKNLKKQGFPFLWKRTGTAAIQTLFQFHSLD